jgi:phosphoribosylcarboxyaminoimidazole (NCAIR) mutase
MSESEAAGKLTRIPGIVEAEATTPVQSVGVPRLSEKGFKTGLLDIVELKIAKNPIIQRVQNALFITFLFCAMVKSLTN